MQKIIPNIWCNRNAEEAGQFYERAFPNATTAVESRYPETGLLDFQASFAGEPLTVAVNISGYRLTLINAGEEFTPNPSISLMLNFDPLLFDASEQNARDALTELWVQLGAGGTELMPLDKYPFSELYGWMQDKYGVSWQLMLTDPAGDPRPFIMPAMMFAGPVQNHAGEAVAAYLDIFKSVEETELGSYFTYLEQVGPAEPGALQFGDFRIGDDWLVAMDAAAAMEFTFGCGVSLEVQCANQDEIDELWTALSAVPEAEQCGWLEDRFGVSWQIVPNNIAELMERPDAYEHMMGMKKLVIDEF